MQNAKGYRRLVECQKNFLQIKDLHDLQVYSEASIRECYLVNPFMDQTENQPQLARRLGLFDATMIVMGGIIGSGIFMNPSVVALQVHTPFLILGAWVLGGLFALAAAFIWAELAALRPDVGGQYAYLREAFHPAVAFLYGWVLLLVIQTGGMAAVAVTFARYFVELTHLPIPSAYLAAIVLALLTFINCLGVRAGSTVQSILMVLKILAIAMLVVCGFLFAGRSTNPSGLLDRPVSPDFFTASAPRSSLSSLLTVAGKQRPSSPVRSKSHVRICRGD